MITEPDKTSFVQRHKRKLIGLGIFLLLDMAGTFDMLLFHTGSFLPPYLEQRQEWSIPTDPRLKRQYEEAQAIVLPDSIPKPVPFNFALARLRAAIPGQPSVATQYFRHLCRTEANEYILKKVPNVEGLLQMRVRPRLDDKELGMLYEVEDPFGYDIQNTTNAYSFLKSFYYSYIEQPLPAEYYDKYTIEHADPSFVQNLSDSTNYIYYSLISNRNYRDLDYVKKTQVISYGSRYGFTWRGIQRPLDRYYMISGGEIIVMDLKNNEILGVKRGFRRALWDDGRIGWKNGAGDCPRYHSEYADQTYSKPMNKPSVPDVEFVAKILMPKNEEKKYLHGMINPKVDGGL